MDSAFAFERGRVDLVLKEEFASELTVLDFLKDFAHLLLGFFIDDARTAGVIAEFRRVGDGVTHVAEAALIEEVDDELHFVHAFEISHFGLITRFDEGFETRLDEVADAAAKNGLFAEEVGFGFFFEGRLDDAAASSADSLSISKTNRLFAIAAFVVESDEAGDAAAFDVFGANEVTRTLRSDHDRAIAFGKIELPVMNVEAVRRDDDRVGLEVRTDLFAEDLALDFVGKRDDDQVRLLDGVFDRHG